MAGRACGALSALGMACSVRILDGISYVNENHYQLQVRQMELPGFTGIVGDRNAGRRLAGALQITERRQIVIGNAVFFGQGLHGF